MNDETIYLVLYTVLVDIERHSQLERHETHFRCTMVIFGNFSLKITVFWTKNLEKMTFVSSQKMLKIDITPAFYTLVPGVVLIPLRIATKLSMTNSENILEN